MLFWYHAMQQSACWTSNWIEFKKLQISMVELRKTAMSKAPEAWKEQWLKLLEKMVLFESC